ALIGPFAEGNDILGPWSFLGSTDDAITVKAGIEQKLNKEVIAAKGIDIETGEDDDLQKAIKLAGEAEVVVLALG
ncbi:beta-glucosidase, partial [Domibacillus sp. 8LH]